MRFYLLILCCLSLYACDQEVQQHTSDKKTATALVPYPLSHASNFEISKEGKYSLLTIKSAWKNASEQFQYLLYPKSEPNPEGYPNALKIPVPVDKIICTSTVDIAFLEFLGASDKIVAVANGAYIYNPKIRQAIEDGKIKEIGKGQTIDYENALTTEADVALVYSIGDQEMYKKFKEIGIPPVMLSDFMEKSPLGRAEWLLFVAHLLGKETIAKEKFEGIAQAYQKLKHKAALYSSKPTVLTGAVYKGTWYVAGGKSLMATFIKDAGARYLWAEDQTVSGLPLDFEAVYARGTPADFWINMSHYTSKEALGAAEEKYKDFKAFQENKLYNYYKRVTGGGGSDIFESAIVQPHLVLNDLIHVFHDKEVHTDSLYYYTELK